MSNKECPNIRQNVRGVIPSKVSDLENDAKYITEDDLRGIVISSETGEYTGLSDEKTKVVVDNLYKTIKVELLKTIQDDLKTLLPVVNGSLAVGSYLLKADVFGDTPVFSFLESGNIIREIREFPRPSLKNTARD